MEEDIRDYLLHKRQCTAVLPPQILYSSFKKLRLVSGLCFSMIKSLIFFVDLLLQTQQMRFLFSQLLCCSLKLPYSGALTHL